MKRSVTIALMEDGEYLVGFSTQGNNADNAIIKPFVKLMNAMSSAHVWMTGSELMNEKEIEKRVAKMNADER